MEPFDDVSKLIAIADDIIHVKAVCSLCCKDASFTLKTSVSNHLIEIGGSELYKPCCRVCFEDNKLFSQ
jgi:thymidine kinase